MPRSSASVGALTRLTSSSVRPANTPFRTDERQQARVALGDPAHVLDLDALDAARPAPRRSRPSRSASGTNGPSTSMSSALTAGMFTAVRDHAAGERGDDLLGGLDAGAVLGLGGATRPGAA